MNKIKKFFLIEVSPGEEAPAPRPWTWGQRVVAGGGDGELINRQMSGVMDVKVLWRRILRKVGREDESFNTNTSLKQGCVW